MFYVKGVLPNEACLVEVQCKVQSLRSRTSFTFVNSSKSVIYVWHGSKSLKETRDVIKKATENLINNKSNEIGLLSDVNYTIKEFEEGKETKEFWDIIENQERKQYRQLYYSLIDSKNSYSYTPRLFHFTSSSGEFESKEISCSYRSVSHVVPYPFMQEDLYSAQQPTFFLFDNQNEVFLWESKFPFTNDSNEETETNTTTGSVNIRWIAERKCALNTTLAYCHGMKALFAYNLSLLIILNFSQRP
jgi:supervillin